MGRSLFITPLERLRRVEVLMRRDNLSWYRLSQLMKVSQISVQRSIQQRNDGSWCDPRISTIKALARALDVSAGFLLDRREP